MESRELVAEQRRYRVLTTEDAKRVATVELEVLGLVGEVDYGLPEIDDRYHIWRVPLVRPRTADDKVGEVVVDARTSLVQKHRSTTADVIRARLADRPPRAEPASASTEGRPRQRRPRSPVASPHLRNTIICGDSATTLVELPAECVQLAFTSPPYFNARPDYTDYVTYEEYLLTIRKVIQQVHRVLEEGRFFVMNVAPVLLRRASRSQASRRIAVPFDMHRLFVEEGFEFIDDIIWEKPEGAGWATGRGRRFAADRNPLQYKAVPVTEYVLVYRKATDRLIDWHIRHHHDPEAVKRSRIEDDYERTNIWRISPTSSKLHPAVFPLELASRVIQYYSFEGEVVLDPFAGIGTVGQAAVKHRRRFVLAEKDPAYVDVIRASSLKWLGRSAEDILCLGCPPVDVTSLLV